MQFPAGSASYFCQIHQRKTGLPWLVLLHGFMGSSRVFEPLLPLLCKFCNPVTIDLAGHGQTTAEPSPAGFSAPSQAEQLYSVFDRLQLNHPVLFGYSMGGRIAFQLLAARKHYFSAAIIESAHCGISAPEKREQRRNDDEERAQQIEKNFPEFVEMWSRLPFFSQTSGEMKKMYREVMSSQKPEYMAASLRYFGAGTMPVVCDDIVALDIPIQFIAGESDTKYVEILSELARLNPRIALSVISGAGHRVHADEPNHWIATIRNVLDR